MLALWLLAGCSKQQPWHSKDVSGLLPPLQFSLTNDQGRVVTAADYLHHDRVTLLYFGYTYCPDVCPLTLGRLSAAIGRLDPPARQHLQVLFVSVDPRRDTPARLAQYAHAFGPQFTGLTGTQEALRTLTKRYRVTYGYGEPDADGNYSVSHSSAIFAFDRDGKVRLLMQYDDGAAGIGADLQRLLETS